MPNPDFDLKPTKIAWTSNINDNKYRINGSFEKKMVDIKANYLNGEFAFHAKMYRSLLSCKKQFRLRRI